MNTTDIVADVVRRMLDGEEFTWGSGLRDLDDDLRQRVRAVARDRGVNATHLWRRLQHTAARHAASRRRLAT